MLLEVSKRRALRVGSDLARKPHRSCVGAGDAAPRQQQIKRHGRSDDFRQQAGRSRRKHAQLYLGLTERGVGRDEQEMTGECELKAAAEALAAHRNQ